MSSSGLVVSRQSRQPSPPVCSGGSGFVASVVLEHLEQAGQGLEVKGDNLIRGEVAECMQSGKSKRVTEGSHSFLSAGRSKCSTSPQILQKQPALHPSHAANGAQVKECRNSHARTCHRFQSGRSTAAQL